MIREDWDTVWMMVAQDISTRSACARRQIGAVVVDPTNRIVATGYNGPPAGLHQECESHCPRQLQNDGTDGYGNCFSIHAEANALLFCDRAAREGGTIYIPEVPCWDCAKLIANSGLKRVVIRILDRSQLHRNPERSLRLFNNSGLDTCIMRNTT